MYSKLKKLTYVRFEMLIISKKKILYEIIIYCFLIIDYFLNYVFD